VAGRRLAEDREHSLHRGAVRRARRVQADRDIAQPADLELEPTLHHEVEQEGKVP
jgi:hypothetical protein